MRKLIFLLIFTVMIVNINNLAGASTGSYQVGSSQPATLGVYYADNWSPIGYWHLSANSLPAQATITKVKVKWDTFSTLTNQSYRGLELMLFNQNKKIKLQPSTLGNYVVTKEFAGQLKEEDWGLKYKVNQLQSAGSYLGLAPKLVIYYQVSN